MMMGNAKKILLGLIPFGLAVAISFFGEVWLILTAAAASSVTVLIAEFVVKNTRTKIYIQTPVMVFGATLIVGLIFWLLYFGKKLVL